MKPILHPCSFFSLYSVASRLGPMGCRVQSPVCWAMRSHRQHRSRVALPTRGRVPGCAECLAVCCSRPRWQLQLLPILASDSWWPGEYVVGLRAWRSVSASLSFILLAPYIISNIFKKHNLNDGAYNSISGVLMTRAWFLWFMMSPGPIDGVVAP